MRSRCHCALDKTGHIIYNIPVLLNKSHIPFKTKLKAVKAYLRGGTSLRKIANDLGIPYATLGFWVRQYKEGGIERLRTRKVHKRKVSKATEFKVMYLKEQNPALSIDAARRALRKQRITISNNGIWQIWKRYGIAKKSIHDQLNSLGVPTPESRIGIAQAKAYIRDGNLKAAAHVLNAVPCLSEATILEPIPAELLSPRRQLDRLPLEYGEIPFNEFWKKARHVCTTLENQGYVYSSIYAHFLGLFALQNMGKPREQIRVLDQLATKLHGVKDGVLWFHYYAHRVLVHFDLLEINQALAYLKQCRRLLHRLPSPPWWDIASALFGSLGFHKDAYKYAMMAFKNMKDPVIKNRLALRVAVVGSLASGDYDETQKMLTKAAKVKHKQGLNAMYCITQAYMTFGRGNLVDASKFLREALEKSYKGELYNRLYATSVGLAGVAMALNKKEDARVHLKKYLPLMKKHNLRREVVTLDFLLDSRKSIPEEMYQMPPFRLFRLLACAQRTGKTGDYRKAYDFAQKYSLLGMLHRMIVFFPQSVVSVLDKGKQTGLPRALLRFPIFNQAAPVYHIRFLGDVVITKDQHYIRTQLRPQEKAFVTHLALRASALNRFVLLSDLYRNFWTQSSKPAERLSHLLVNIKNQLKIPRHLLTISSTTQEARLSNRGVYFTTDYSEFETLLTQARSLERAGEWQFAKGDYMKAFTLLRSTPFEKMYDHWSEQMRSAILNKVENEGIHFAKKCLESDNKKEAHTVLEKVAKITCRSEAVDKLLEELKS